MLIIRKNNELHSINWTTQQERMVQRGGGNKSTGAKQVPINDCSIKTKEGHKQQKRLRPKNIDKNQQGRSPTVPTTSTSKNNKDRQCRQQPTLLHTPGRLIQPPNLLKVLTANVQSLSPKIDELIALIQVENFVIIACTQ